MIRIKIKSKRSRWIAGLLGICLFISTPPEIQADGGWEIDTKDLAIGAGICLGAVGGLTYIIVRDAKEAPRVKSLRLKILDAFPGISYGQAQRRAQSVYKRAKKKRRRGIYGSIEEAMDAELAASVAEWKLQDRVKPKGKPAT